MYTSRLYSLGRVHLGVRLLGQRICARSALLEMPNLFSKVPVLVFVSTNNMCDFFLLDILTILRFVRVFKYRQYFMALMGLKWYLLVLICSYLTNKKIVIYS